MKNIENISVLILLILSINFFNSCKKEKPAPPVVTTAAATEISFTTAVSGGNITSEGGATVISRGVCWNTAADPTITNSIKAESGTLGSFTSNLTQLTPNTKYYVKAYATNAGGTGYGVQVTFTTRQVTVPALTTADITSITQTTSVSGGNITAENGGSVTARGLCWSTSHNPTISDNKTNDGTGAGTFTSSISGLAGMTTYYVRAYATNYVGTAYGNEMSFKTYAVTDIGGNGYYSVTIGTQTWMAENLKTSKYNDGTAIPLVIDNTLWSNLITPGYCWYTNDDVTYKTTYGALYNWYAVNTGKLCPIGWHVSTDAEWITLTNYLGGSSVAGGKMKEIGITHWASPNTGATNESGFTALPAGYRASSGIFYYIGDYGRWWCSTEFDMQSGWGRGIGFDVPNLSIYGYLKNIGFSVRCLKDNQPGK